MTEESTTYDANTVQVVDYVTDLKLLASFRQRETEAMLDLKALRTAFEASPEYLETLSRLRNVREYVEKMTEVIKHHTLGDYQDTGNKHVHQDVKIRMVSRLVYETKQAVEYCKDNLINALKLDYSFFEKHARAVAATAPLDFVKIEMQPQVTISTDLSAYLDNEPVVVDIDFEKIEPIPV